MSERSHDNHMTPDDAPFTLPTFKEVIDEILMDSVPPDNAPHPEHEGGANEGQHHVTTSYCVPVAGCGSRVGSREFPAYDCGAIRRENATVTSGFFWIDPNLGCSSDAVRVFCNFSSHQTCLYPQQHQVHLKIEIIATIFL